MVLGEQKRLGGLDGLRALSVLGVIVYHLYIMYSPSQVAHGLVWRIFSGFALRGFFGVTVFFSLSGFLITWLLLKEEARAGRISLASFYVRRGLRILPPAILFLVVVCLLSVIGILSLPRG